MTKPRKYWFESWKPDTTEALLLNASLLQGDAVQSAWTHLRPTIELDNANGQVFWLLPRLYRNLESHGIADPELGRLKGLYRYTWSNNQVVIGEVVRILSQLHEAAISPVVLGDLALLAHYAYDFGLIPIGTPEIGIPFASHEKSLEVLSKLGWTSEQVPVSRLPFLRGIKLHNARGSEIQLRWYLIPQCCWPGADDPIWQMSVPVLLNGVSTLALDPAHELLRIIAEAAWRDDHQNATWIARAMTVLRATGQDIDWLSFCGQANTYHLTLPCFAALSVLNSALYYPIPRFVLDQLASVERTTGDQYEYAMPRYRLFKGLRTHWHRYSTFTHRATLSQKLVGFPAYLQAWWGLACRWQIPVHLLSTGLHKARRRPKQSQA